MSLGYHRTIGTLVWLATGSCVIMLALVGLLSIALRGEKLAVDEIFELNSSTMPPLPQMIEGSDTVLGDGMLTLRIPIGLDLDNVRIGLAEESYAEYSWKCTVTCEGGTDLIAGFFFFSEGRRRPFLPESWDEFLSHGEWGIWKGTSDGARLIDRDSVAVTVEDEHLVIAISSSAFLECLLSQDAPKVLITTGGILQPTVEFEKVIITSP